MRKLGLRSGLRGFRGGAAGSAAPAHQQILTLAAADGWEAVWDPTNPDTRTLDGSGNISDTADGLGNRGSLTQTTEANRPVYTEGRFGGFDAGLYSSDLMVTDAAEFGAQIFQPFMRIVLVERISGDGWIFSGGTGASTRIPQRVTGGKWQVFGSGGALTSEFDADAGKHVFSVIADGANSLARLDGAQFATGDLSTIDHRSNAVGARGDLAGAFNGYIGLAMIYDGRDDTKLSRMESLIQSLGTFAASTAPLLMWVGL